MALQQNQNAPGPSKEIEHAIAKEDSRIGPHRVQVYFCDKVENISRVSLTDLKRVEDYREDLSTRGLFYRKFVDDDELQREVRINIQRLITEYLNSSGQGDTDSSAAAENVQTAEQGAAESIPRVTIQFNQAKKLLIDALADCVQMSDEAGRGLLSILARN